MTSIVPQSLLGITTSIEGSVTSQGSCRAFFRSQTVLPISKITSQCLTVSLISIMVYGVYRTIRLIVQKRKTNSLLSSVRTNLSPLTKSKETLSELAEEGPLSRKALIIDLSRKKTDAECLCLLSEEHRLYLTNPSGPILYLQIKNHRESSNALLLKIAKIFREIRAIDLQNMPYLSSKDLKLLIHQLPHLQRIYLTECPLIPNQITKTACHLIKITNSGVTYSNARELFDAYEKEILSILRRALLSLVESCYEHTMHSLKTALQAHQSMEEIAPLITPKIRKSLDQQLSTTPLQQLTEEVFSMENQSCLYRLSESFKFSIRSIPLSDIQLIPFMLLFQMLNAHLKHLDLSGSSVTGSILDHAKELPIQTLSLRSLTHFCSDFLKFLPSFKCLRVLDLSENSLEESDILQKIVDIPLLIVLYMDSCRAAFLEETTKPFEETTKPFEETTIETIGMLLGCRQLCLFSLLDTPVSEETLKKILDAGSLDKRKNFVIATGNKQDPILRISAANMLHEETVKCLQRLPYKGSVKNICFYGVSELDMSPSDSEDEPSTFSLRKLFHIFPEITMLDLSCSQIEENDLLHIIKSLSLCSLKWHHFEIELRDYNHQTLKTGYLKIKINTSDNIGKCRLFKSLLNVFSEVSSLVIEGNCQSNELFILVDKREEDVLADPWCKRIKLQKLILISDSLHNEMFVGLGGGITPSLYPLFECCTEIDLSKTKVTEEILQDNDKRTDSCRVVFARTTKYYSKNP